MVENVPSSLYTYMVEGIANAPLITPPPCAPSPSEKATFEKVRLAVSDVCTLIQFEILESILALKDARFRSELITIPS